MKPVYSLIIFVLIFYSCKKEVTQYPGNSFFETVKKELSDRMSRDDYTSLDFSRVVLNKVDSVGLYFVRIPFRGKGINKNFVIVRTLKSGSVLDGRIVNLSGDVVEAGQGPVKKREWEGTISLSSLNRIKGFSSGVHKGYIGAFHPAQNAREAVYGSDELPEVVVVAYVSSASGIDYSTWLCLTSLIYNSGEGGYVTDGYYGSLDGGGGGSYGGTSGGSYGGTAGGSYGVSVDQTMLVDVDTYVDHPAIDVGQYLKCFGTIPDQGASCSVEIFTDIPVDSDPSKLFNYQTRSPGHTFLQLRKSSADGTQVIVQNIGFYPQSNWTKVLDSNPIDSKIVDDGDHEFNASLKMNLSSTAFSSVLGKIQELSSLKYDMDEFNCTDFALEVFNYVRTPLQVPQYAIPGAMGTNPSNTPQGLFVKLKEMQANRDPEVANISLPGVKGWVAYSKGPCY
jgi:hypothetical protein